MPQDIWQDVRRSTVRHQPTAKRRSGSTSTHVTSLTSTCSALLGAPLEKPSQSSAAFIWNQRWTQTFRMERRVPVNHTRAPESVMFHHTQQQSLSEHTAAERPQQHQHDQQNTFDCLGFCDSDVEDFLRGMGSRLSVLHDRESSEDPMQSNTVYFVSLDLSENRLSCAGVQAITSWFSKHTRFVRLRTLKLYKNSVADAGALALADLILSQPSPLEELHLSHNKITSVGAAAVFSSFSHARRQTREGDPVAFSRTSSPGHVVTTKEQLSPGHWHFLYPRYCENYTRQGTTVMYLPIWIRLEYNQIVDTGKVLQRWEADCRQLRGRLLASHTNLVCFAHRPNIPRSNREPHCSPARCLGSTNEQAALLHLYSYHHQSVPALPTTSSPFPRWKNHLTSRQDSSGGALCSSQQGRAIGKVSKKNDDTRQLSDEHPLKNPSVHARCSARCPPATETSTPNAARHPVLLPDNLPMSLSHTEELPLSKPYEQPYHADTSLTSARREHQRVLEAEIRESETPVDMFLTSTLSPYQERSLSSSTLSSPAAVLGSYVTSSPNSEERRATFAGLSPPAPETKKTFLRLVPEQCWNPAVEQNYKTPLTTSKQSSWSLYPSPPSPEELSSPSSTRVTESHERLEEVSRNVLKLFDDELQADDVDYGCVDPDTRQGNAAMPQSFETTLPLQSKAVDTRPHSTIATTKERVPPTQRCDTSLFPHHALPNNVATLLSTPPSLPLYIFLDASAFAQMQRLYEASHEVNLFSFPGLLALYEKKVLCHSCMRPWSRRLVSDVKHGHTEDVFDANESLIVMVMDCVEDDVFDMTTGPLREAFQHLDQTFLHPLTKAGVIERFEALNDPLLPSSTTPPPTRWRVVHDALRQQGLAMGVPLESLRVLDLAYTWTHHLGTVSGLATHGTSLQQPASSSSFTLFLTSDPNVETFFGHLVAQQNAVVAVSGAGDAKDSLPFLSPNRLLCINFSLLNRLLRDAYPQLATMVQRPGSFEPTETPYGEGHEVVSASSVRQLLQNRLHEQCNLRFLDCSRTTLDVQRNVSPPLETQTQRHGNTLSDSLHDAQQTTNVCRRDTRVDPDGVHWKQHLAATTTAYQQSVLPSCANTDVMMGDGQRLDPPRQNDVIKRLQTENRRWRDELQRAYALMSALCYSCSVGNTTMAIDQHVVERCRLECFNWRALLFPESPTDHDTVSTTLLSRRHETLLASSASSHAVGHPTDSRKAKHDGTLFGVSANTPSFPVPLYESCYDVVM